MQLRPIQEFMRLGNSLDRRINLLSEDQMYMAQPNSMRHINKMRDRRRMVQMVIDNFIMFQWMIDHSITDDNLMNEQS